VSHPKFYFFDCGLVNALRHELKSELIHGTQRYGDLFEQFIVLEIMRLINYKEKEASISFFRTTDGAEVDIILEISNEIWALEIKSSADPPPSELRGLRSFMEDHPYNRAICICQADRKYIRNTIEFYPWQEFLGILYR